MQHKQLSHADLLVLREKMKSVMHDRLQNPASFARIINFFIQLTEVVNESYQKTPAFANILETAENILKNEVDKQAVQFNLHYDNQHTDLIELLFDPELQRIHEQLKLAEEKIQDVILIKKIKFSKISDKVIMDVSNENKSVEYSIKFSDNSVLTFASMESNVRAQAESVFNEKMNALSVNVSNQNSPPFKR